MKICSVPDCGRKHKAQGLCNTHHNRLWRTGTTEPKPQVKRQLKAYRTCDVEGCEKKHEAKGLCGMHYKRVLKTGTTDLEPRVKNESAPKPAKVREPKAKAERAPKPKKTKCNGMPVLREVEPFIRRDGKAIAQVALRCKCGNEFITAAVWAENYQVFSCGCGQVSNRKEWWQ